ncbi:MAG: RdgB/HAM1 family non-canonical purine NTP pyrophosphatase [Phascolarctobacterium sp.]|nr:RdgB/HAM1 family non-canonical purine NTP pyrophosphatase [Phascolarctobacterium sp.]
MIKELVIATKNQGKLLEFKELMKEIPVEIKCLADFPEVEEPVENGRTFAANARLKAMYYSSKLGLPCIADDSGLEVQALEGAPGVRSARYAGEKATDQENIDLLLYNMKFQVKRVCRFRCALCVVDEKGKVLHEVDGICEGMLLHEPLGELGFGYDPIFWSTELHKGMGEATMQEKNKISHRGKAIRKLVALWSKKK